jgi:hypothetical protein
MEKLWTCFPRYVKRCVRRKTVRRRLIDRRVYPGAIAGVSEVLLLYDMTM